MPIRWRLTIFNALVIGGILLALGCALFSCCARNCSPASKTLLVSRLSPLPNKSTAGKGSTMRKADSSSTKV